jgi:phage RecT family recombinase
VSDNLPAKASSRDRAEAFLAPIMNEIKAGLPATITPERFQAAFVTALAKDPNIGTCDPSSVRMALLQCAADGLVPDGRRAALVVFNDSRAGKKVCQYIPMVQGIIARARELGEILSVTANVVFAYDVFEVDETDPSATKHVRKSLSEDRGAPVGAYVIFRDDNGRVVHREIMTKREIEAARAVSRAKNSPAWSIWADEMWRKTVIRRGSKYVPMSDSLRAIIEREDQYADFKDVTPPQVGTAGVTARLQAAKAAPPIQIEEHVAVEMADAFPGDTPIDSVVPAPSRATEKAGETDVASVTPAAIPGSPADPVAPARDENEVSLYLQGWRERLLSGEAPDALQGAWKEEAGHRQKIGMKPADTAAIRNALMAMAQEAANA